MADSGSSNTGIVALFAIFIIVAGGVFFAWQGGMFGGGSSAPAGDSVDLNVDLPDKVDIKPGDSGK